MKSNLRISFPLPAPALAFDLKSDQDITINGVTATVRKTADGQLEITDQPFIEKLLALGFKPGRNDTPERILAIYRQVPDEFKDDFLNGVIHGSSATPAKTPPPSPSAPCP